MFPLRLYVVCCYLACNTAVKVRTVRGIVGRNASIYFTFSNTDQDIIYINQINSKFVVVWPKRNTIVEIKQPQRVSVAIGKNADFNTTTVTINILNLSKDDSGNYSAIRLLRPMEILESVLLEIYDESLIPNIEMVLNHSLDAAIVLKCKVSNTLTGNTWNILWSLNGSLIEDRSRYSQADTFLYIMNLTADDKYNLYTCKESGGEFESDPYSIKIWIDHYITIATTSIEDTTALKHFTTKTFRKIDNTDGIYHDETTKTVAYVDTEGTNTSSNGVPEERYLVFIMLGMGFIFAVAFVAIRGNKERICAKGSNTASNDADHLDGFHNENLAGTYWTIVSNTQGEMRTIIETDLELQRENPLFVPHDIPKKSLYEDSIKSDDIYVRQEIVGYLNPISTSLRDLDGYIHPIQSNPLSTPFPKQMLDTPTSTWNRKMQGYVKSISI